MSNLRVILTAAIACLLSLASAAQCQILAETKGWGIENKGSASANGLIYFVRGYSVEAVPDWHLVPHFLRTLNAEGWDVIVDRIRPCYEPDQTLKWPQRRKAEIARATTEVQRRISGFKRSGYKTIVATGHSFGGWVFLEAITRNPALVHRVILSAPTAHGRTRIRSGEKNVLFQELVSASRVRFGQIKVPTFVMIFKGDEYEPAGRPAAVSRAVAGNEMVFLVDRPAAFSGHFSAWTPIFDFVYGDCLRHFLSSTDMSGCTKDSLSTDDWRSVVTFAPDLPGAQKNTFVEISGNQTARLKVADNTSRESFRFSPSKGNSPAEICIGGDCGKLVVWRPEILLEFDRKTNALRYWWLQQ
jgi:pimeloyl-ACP methyl ester carboxylesterase